MARISTRKRKGQRAEVLTSSPIKKIQYEKMKNAEAKILKTQPKRLAKKILKKKQSEDQESTCPICSENYVKGPDGKLIEDWIMCFMCEKWYHEDSTSHLRKSQFICDFCEDQD